MLILFPILMWWAKSPMRFAQGRSRTVVGAVSLVALSLAVFHDASTAIAEDRLPVADESRARDTVQDGQAKVIREGTTLPPTEGRIVMAGRRWAFLADASDPAAKDDFVGILPQAKPMSRLVGLRRVESSEAGSSSGTASSTFAPRALPRASLDQTNRFFGDVRLVTTPADQVIGSVMGDLMGDVTDKAIRAGGSLVSETDARMNLTLPQFVLVENLSLQRIVEAIQADPSDDRWIITGTVNEYFGSNGLTIQTAQRSNSK